MQICLYVSMIQSSNATITDIISMDNDEIDGITCEKSSILDAVSRVSIKLLQHVLPSNLPYL
jgi:hypothetical protein